MSRKELRSIVLEAYPAAVCRQVPDSGRWVVAALGRPVGVGRSKRAAWENAAEELTR